jgi:hypothetical protein
VSPRSILSAGKKEEEESDGDAEASNKILTQNEELEAEEEVCRKVDKVRRSEESKSLEGCRILKVSIDDNQGKMDFKRSTCGMYRFLSSLMGEGDPLKNFKKCLEDPLLKQCFEQSTIYDLILKKMPLLYQLGELYFRQED